MGGTREKFTFTPTTQKREYFVGIFTKKCRSGNKCLKKFMKYIVQIMMRFTVSKLSSHHTAEIDNINIPVFLRMI